MNQLLSDHENVYSGDTKENRSERNDSVTFAMHDERRKENISISMSTGRLAVV